MNEFIVSAIGSGLGIVVAFAWMLGLGLCRRASWADAGEPDQ